MPLPTSDTQTRPLAGRTALVTGVGRRRGIGYAIASRLARAGASLVIHHWRPYDETQAWGGDDLAALESELRAELAPGALLDSVSLDLAAPDAGETLVARAVEAAGHLDALVCNHAYDLGDGSILDQTADVLDAHFAVNTRATLLATKAFTAQHDGRPGGRVVWMTSGQQLGPMPGQIAYATSKAALAGITRSVAADLADRGIILNTVNPGPVNTGYLDDDSEGATPEGLAGLRAMFPSGSFGEPDDPARLIAWLVSDEGRWVVGQVLNTEGGFRRG